MGLLSMKKNTTNANQFSLLIFGLNEKEKFMISNICKISQTRNTATYTTIYITLKFSYESVSGAYNIAIVDFSNKEAVMEWTIACQLGYIKAENTIYIINNEDKRREDIKEIPEKYLIKRPLAISRLLKKIDEIVMDFYNFVVINDDTPMLSKKVLDLSKSNIKNNSTIPIKAMVVDDNHTILQGMELELNRLGIKGKYLESGEAALKAFQEDFFDLVFLDVELPGLDGYSICKKIKAQHTTYVIMLTGRGSAFDKLKGSLAGCDSYLVKPVTGERMTVLIKDYIKKIFPDDYYKFKIE